MAGVASFDLLRGRMREAQAFVWAFGRGDAADRANCRAAGVRLRGCLICSGARTNMRPRGTKHARIACGVRFARPAETSGVADRMSTAVMSAGTQRAPELLMRFRSVITSASLTTQSASARPLSDSKARAGGAPRGSGGEAPARPAGAATPANHSTEIYWFPRSAAAVAMYFESK
jgi:hypothetical protein